MPTFIDALNARQWTEDAACLGYPDLDAFFLEGPSGQADVALGSVRALKAMLTCVSCPVRTDCLRYALTPAPLFGRPVGIWAATTHLERQRLRGTPVDLAVDALEDGLPARVRARLDAVTAKHPQSVPLILDSL